MLVGLLLFFLLTDLPAQGRKLSFSIPDTLSQSLDSVRLTCTYDGHHCFAATEITQEFRIEQIDTAGVMWLFDADRAQLIMGNPHPINYDLKVGDIVLWRVDSRRLEKVRVPFSWKGYFFYNEIYKKRHVWVTLKY